MLWQPTPIPEIVIVGMGNTANLFVKKVFEEGKFWNGQLWAVNHAGLLFRSDLIWCVHDAATMQEIFNEECDTYKGWITQAPAPVVLAEAWDTIPNSLGLDLDFLVEHFGTTEFTSSIAYMVACAMLCKPKRLWFFGTDFNYMGLDAVSEARKHAYDYWRGRAKERGIEIKLPAGVTAVNDVDVISAGMYGIKKQPVLDVSGKVLSWR